MTARGGIGAPETVPHGTQTPIEITGGGAGEELLVTVIGTGQRFVVKMDDQGNGRFELPPGTVVGEILVVMDLDEPGGAVAIEVVPASSI